ncbi:MAG: hypothetical protein IT206_08460 [Fimbriimonadaceae bacterium]|nr:hypothetical protein [Fimbriimonadaceae bacterium]
MPTDSLDSLRLIHLNDLHGKLRPEHVGVISALRTDNCLCLETGDGILAGNLGIPGKEEKVWGLYAQIPMDAGTIGNRETHLMASAFEAKLRGHQHPLLCANLTRKDDGTFPLPGSLILERNGWRIGLLGTSVAMVTAKMAARAASAFIWEDPIVAAQREARALRPGVDLLIALTHIGLSKDKQLAEVVPEIDLILGGHSHSVLDTPIRENQTWICQGGSHARFVGVYDLDVRTKQLTGGLIPLP